MLNEVLATILTEAQRGAGLSLEELDDHLLALKQDSKVVALFNATSVGIGTIKKEAEHHCRSLARKRVLSNA